MLKVNSQEIPGSIGHLLIMEASRRYVQFLKRLMNRLGVLEYVQIYRRVGCKFGIVLFISLTTLLTGFFEAASMGLLIPLIKGLIQTDFQFINDFWLLERIVSCLPVIANKPNASLFVFLSIVIFGASLFSKISLYMGKLMVNWATLDFQSRLRKSLFSRYLSFGKLFHDRSNLGQLQGIITVFAFNISTALRRFFTSMVSIVMILSYGTLMFFVSWKFSLVVVALFPFLHVMTNWLSAKIQKISKMQAKSGQQFHLRVSEALTCIPLIKAHSQESQEKYRFNRISDEIAELNYRSDKQAALIDPLQDLISIAIILILTSVCFFLIKKNSVDLAGFFVFFVMFRRVSTNLNTVNGVRVLLSSVSGELAKVNEIFSDADKHYIVSGKTTFEGVRKEIRFNHLNFSYGRNKSVLHDIDLTIEGGKVTAIVGPTGAGKSTVINLLMRFYDCRPGEILVDGKDILDFSLPSLRDAVAYVPQDPLLFNDSFRNNICYGLKREVSEGELLEVMKKARLYDFAMKLPFGVDTKIGDRGVRISGGEKQRVAIARAVLKGSDMLIMDEATSALDSKTEKLIQEAIDDAVAGRTAIVIAHRLSTIRHADKIAVLENGRVVESGCLDELLEKKARFYQYWKAQQFS